MTTKPKVFYPWEEPITPSIMLWGLLFDDGQGQPLQRFHFYAKSKPAAEELCSYLNRKYDLSLETGDGSQYVVISLGEWESKRFYRFQQGISDAFYLNQECLRFFERVLREFPLTQHQRNIATDTVESLKQKMEWAESSFGELKKICNNYDGEKGRE